MTCTVHDMERALSRGDDSVIFYDGRAYREAALTELLVLTDYEINNSSSQFVGSISEEVTSVISMKMIMTTGIIGSATINKRSVRGLSKYEEFISSLKEEVENGTLVIKDENPADDDDGVNSMEEVIEDNELKSESEVPHIPENAALPAPMPVAIAIPPAPVRPPELNQVSSSEEAKEIVIKETSEITEIVVAPTKKKKPSALWKSVINCNPKELEELTGVERGSNEMVRLMEGIKIIKEFRSRLTSMALGDEFKIAEGIEFVEGTDDGFFMPYKSTVHIFDKTLNRVYIEMAKDKFFVGSWNYLLFKELMMTYGVVKKTRKKIRGYGNCDIFSFKLDEEPIKA